MLSLFLKYKEGVMKKYLEVYDYLKRDIVEGVYKSGDKLPSKRILADKFNVSTITVEHAYELLLEEGYVESIEKKGYFVLYKTGDFHFNGVTPLNKITFESSYYSSQINESNISCDLYSRTVRNVLTNYGEEIMVKSPSFGHIILRTAISDYLLRSRHIKVSPEQILIGAGAEYLYGLIIRVFGVDDIYGIETPGYRRIKEVYEKDGAKTQELLLGKDGIQSSELWKSDAKILHITPYRSYPTGVSASAGKKREYIKWAEEKDAILIEDDFESEFNTIGKSFETLYSMDTKGNVIYVNSFTRTVAPSVRMAYMLIPAKLIGLFEEKIGFYSCPVATLEQLTVATLLNNGDFERHINRVRRKQQKDKKRSK